MEVLDGIPEEDVQLIRHLTWLYGGYSMRTRKCTNFAEPSSDEEEEEDEANYIKSSYSSTSKSKESKTDSGSKRSKVEETKQRFDRTETEYTNGMDSRGKTLLLPEDAVTTASSSAEWAVSTLNDMTASEEKTSECNESGDSSMANSIVLPDPYEDCYMRSVDTLVLDRRRPRWANGLSLKDKINKFLETGVSSATEMCDGTPTTLSICNQFELSNHEAMVADVDRVHYYRAAIFWTGFKEYKTEASELEKATIAQQNVDRLRYKEAEGNNDLVVQNDEETPVDVKIGYASTKCDSDEDINSDSGAYYCTKRRVLEVGTGPMCVLAMNALNAGAEYIDALEVSNSAARLAAKLMAAYGVQNKIRVFNCHSKNFFFDTESFFGMRLKDQQANCEIQLPSEPPYDMIISEILGDFCSQEGVADVFLDIQRRILFNKPEYINKVKSIPTAAATMFTPCVFPDAENVVNKSAVHEHTTIFTPTRKMLQSVGLRIDNLPLCEEWKPIEELNFEKWMQPQMCQHYESIFHISSSGPMCGYLIGIDVEIRPNEHFGTRFGHCESWYTNVVLFDKEYQVYPGDVLLTRSVANLTNYVVSSCFGDKIQVSRPSYSIRSYVISRVYPGIYPTEDGSVYVYDELISRKIQCPCLGEASLQPVNTVKIKSLSELSVDVINIACLEPEDFLEGYEWVRVGDDLYRIRLRPPIVTIDYNEQTCATAAQAPSAKKKLPTDPPRRYKRVKAKM
ncbi:hypothetical protein BgAZ_106790 [Babesia gibsoni]|uniref:Uncharacterized protein n=1 Tax=Babesia gibsoni TaxID=33632 RepID=A0AAD8PG15_BABGI|nr:hypothetical protein BgAZ_106790 [Babesia gibsoni]